MSNCMIDWAIVQSVIVAGVDVCILFYIRFSAGLDGSTCLRRLPSCNEELELTPCLIEKKIPVGTATYDHNMRAVRQLAT